MKKMQLAIDTTYFFAKTHYSARQSIDGRPLFDHCKNVATLAEKIAVKLYSDIRGEFLSPESRDSIANIVHTGLLHHAIDIGECPFEHVVDVSSVQVAAMVADISRDFRLIETKRDLEYRGRVSQSPVGAQVVVLADIICAAKEIIALTKAEGKSAIPKGKKLLTQLDADLMSLHAVTRYYILRQYSVAARGLLRQVSQLFKELRAQAKEARAMSRLTERIKNKAAKRKIQPDTAPAPDEQDTLSEKD